MIFFCSCSILSWVYLCEVMANNPQSSCAQVFHICILPIRALYWALRVVFWGTFQEEMEKYILDDLFVLVLAEDMLSHSRSLFLSYNVKNFKVIFLSIKFCKFKKSNMQYKLREREYI